MKQSRVAQQVINELGKLDAKDQLSVLVALAEKLGRPPLTEGQHVPITIVQDEPLPPVPAILQRRPVRRSIDRDCLKLAPRGTCTLTFTPKEGNVTSVVFIGATKVALGPDPKTPGNEERAWCVQEDAKDHLEVVIEGVTAKVTNKNLPGGGTYIVAFTVTLDVAENKTRRAEVLLYS